MQRITVYFKVKSVRQFTLLPPVDDSGDVVGVPDVFSGILSAGTGVGSVEPGPGSGAASTTLLAL